MGCKGSSVQVGSPRLKKEEAFRNHESLFNFIWFKHSLNIIELFTHVFYVAELGIVCKTVTI